MELRLHPSFALAALTALLATACSTGEISEPIGEEVSSEPVLAALEAYRGNDQYLLRYRRGEDTYYVAGDLKGRTPEPERDAGYLVPDLALVDHERPSEWVEMTRTLTPIPILGIADWAAFRDVAFADFLPTSRNTGVTVSFDRGDYFFLEDLVQL